MLKEYYELKVEILMAPPILKKMKEHLDQVTLRDRDLKAKKIDLASRERILDAYMKVHNITKKDLQDSHVSAI
jgi:hypothetical protein